MTLDEAEDGIDCDISARLAKLAAGPVIGHVLFQRIQLAAQIFHTPLQQVADGENPQEFTVVVGDRQMPEVAFQHNGQCFPWASSRVAISTGVVIRSRTGVVWGSSRLSAIFRSTSAFGEKFPQRGIRCRPRLRLRRGGPASYAWHRPRLLPAEQRDLPITKLQYAHNPSSRLSAT